MRDPRNLKNKENITVIEFSVSPSPRIYDTLRLVAELKQAFQKMKHNGKHISVAERS